MDSKDDLNEGKFLSASDELEETIDLDICEISTPETNVTEKEEKNDESVVGNENPENVDLNVCLRPEEAATVSNESDWIPDSIIKHVKFASKKPSIIQPEFFPNQNVSLSNLYDDHTQEIELSSDQIVDQTTENLALNNSSVNDTLPSELDLSINDTFEYVIQEISSSLLNLPREIVPTHVNTWISGIKHMYENPKMDSLRQELMMSLKTQIKTKNFDLPFTMPFSMNDIKRKIVVAGRQQVASTPKKFEERLKDLVEEERKRQIREQSIYIEPHKLYGKMPKPKEGFVVYGACFGQPKM